MKKKIPAYYSFRQYSIAFLLYYLLVFPTGMILWLKHSPEWLNKQSNLTISLNVDHNTIALDGNKQDTDTTQADTTIAPPAISPVQSSNFNDSFAVISRSIFYTLLITMIIGISVSFPFKRYFKRLRRNKPVTDRLATWCRRYLFYTPWIHAAILGFAFIILHTIILIRMNAGLAEDTAGIERELFRQYFFISLTASTLIIIFLYSWQKHRMHLRYIEHLFSHEELRNRPFKNRPGRIRSRLWISSGMTTLFPISIVIFYLFLSTTTVAEIGIQTFSDDHARLLFGKYLDLFGSVPKTELARNFFYVNAIDSILMFAGIFTGIFVSFIYIIFYVRWNTEDIVRPVKELLASMERTGKGQFGQYGLVRTNDEIGILTEGYNQMTQRMKDYVEDISAINRTYSQFVPRQFLDILGRRDYTEIRLGDQIEGEMSVLFSDIRSFTTISEGMTPKESFDYINAYLGYMEPVIRDHNGFIDKYIGDAIMAVFPDAPDDALKAAIEMRKALDRFNAWSEAHKGISINTGIGIHTGRLMMGVVGTEGRLSGTVISDAVNLASRLEGLNKRFGSSIIISLGTWEKLHNSAQFHARCLGDASLRGKAELVRIFELLDGDPETLRLSKIAHLELFSKALEAMSDQSRKAALKLFREYLEMVPDDKVAQALMDECRSEAIF